MAINSKTTFTLSCTTQYGGFCGYNTTYTKTCKSEVTVDVYLPCENYFGVPFSVSSSKTDNINIGEEITLKATGCPTTVNWNNGKTGTIITVKPAETLTYVALCSRTPLTPCGDIVKLNVNSFKILAQPLKDSYKIAENITLTAQGCGGIVKWSTGEEGNSIVVQPVTNITYEAVCMDKKATQNIKVDKFLAPEIVCEDFKPKATPTTIFKGESNTVKLIGDGCTNGKVIWKNKSTGTIISNLSPTDASVILSNATTFIATCNKVVFSPSVIEVPINATLRNFQLTASKTQIPYGKTQPVILTTTGCIGGSVFWSDGEAQGQAVRTVNLSPPKTFQATCKGEDFEASKTVTINVQLTGSGAVLVGTQGTCPKNFGINFYKNATDKKPYYGFPVVKPGQEIKLEVVGCNTTPIWSWDNQYSINTYIKTKQNDRVTYYTVKCGSTCSAFIGVTAFDCEGWQNTTKEESWPVNDIIDLVPNVSCPVTVSWYKNEGSGFNYYGIEENERGGIGVRVTNTITTYKAVCSIDGVDCSLSYTIKPKINATIDAPFESPVAAARVSNTTTTCSETKIQLKQAMAGYIAGLLCADINLLKDKDGKVSADKVAIFLPKLEATLNTIGNYQLPNNKDEIVNAIVNGNIESCDYGNAAELLADTYEGDILFKDYNEKIKTSTEINEGLVKETAEAMETACTAPKPTVLGKEGEKQITKGYRIRKCKECEVEDCTTTWIYFAGRAGSSIKADWYKEKDYHAIPKLLNNFEPLVFIHGTFSNPSAFTSEFKNMFIKAVGSSKILGSVDVEWSGGNYSEDRMKAADEVANQINTTDNINKLNKLGFKKYVILVSHSHGGNVAKIIKNNLESKGWVVDIINIETPQRNDFQTDRKGNGIYLNFYSSKDLIQFWGSYLDFDNISSAGPIGTRKDPNAGANGNIELFPYLETLNSQAILWYNVSKWVLVSAGHSLQNDITGQWQILYWVNQNYK